MTRQSVNTKKLEEYQKLAIDLALRAGEIMKQNFSLKMPTDWKKDNTPITIADKKINQMVLDAIKERYPDHSVIAEEGSRMVKNSEYTWVCDPIDGTMPFSHGYPIFTFSIAFLKNGEVLMGVIYDPMNNHLTTSIKDQGAFINGKRISVSTETKISKTSLIEVSCDSKLLPLREVLIKKTDCWASVHYSACYSGIMVASGNVLAEIFEYNKPWDAAAVKIIVEEAGGKVTDLHGKDQRYDQEINGFIASNRLVHQELLDILSPLVKT